jgi:NADPH:quinone reductase-like Zn-dependent oxidoreductase
MTFDEAILKLTGELKFAYKRTLRPKGTYAMIGGPMPRVLQLFFMDFWAKLTRESRKFRLVAEGPNKGLANLKELIESGKLVSIVDSTYQMSEVPEAMRYFGEGRHKGKIVITVKK